MNKFATKMTMLIALLAVSSCDKEAAQAGEVEMNEEAPQELEKIYEDENLVFFTRPPIRRAFDLISFNDTRVEFDTLSYDGKEEPKEEFVIVAIPLEDVAVISMGWSDGMPLRNEIEIRSKSGKIDLTVIDPLIEHSWSRDQSPEDLRAYQKVVERCKNLDKKWQSTISGNYYEFIGDLRVPADPMSCEEYMTDQIKRVGLGIAGSNYLLTSFIDDGDLDPKAPAELHSENRYINVVRKLGD